MSRAQWYISLSQAGGEVGITMTASDDRYSFVARWPVDASGEMIAEKLHDLASDLETADPK